MARIPAPLLALPALLAASAASAGLPPITLPTYLPYTPGQDSYATIIANNNATPVNRAITMYGKTMSGGRVVGSGSTADLQLDVLVWSVGATCPVPTWVPHGSTLDYGEAFAIDGDHIVGIGLPVDGAQLFAPAWDLSQPMSCGPTLLNGPAGTQNPTAQGVSGSIVVGHSYPTTASPSAGGATVWDLSDPTHPYVLNTSRIASAIDGHLVLSHNNVWDLSLPGHPISKVIAGADLYAISGNIVIGSYTPSGGVAQGAFADVSQPTPTMTVIPVAAGDFASVFAVSGTKLAGSIQHGGVQAAYVWDINDLSNPIALDGLGGDTYATGVEGNIAVGHSINADGAMMAVAWDLTGGGTLCAAPAAAANAGGDRTVSSTTVALDGSASQNGVSYQWSEGCTVLANTATATVTLSAGLHQIWLKVTDARGGVATNVANITVDPSTACASGVTAGIAGLTYAPAQGANGTLMFEDQWPKDGDFDFNDQVLSYNYEIGVDGSGNVTALQATYNVLSSGATYRNGAYLHLPLPANAAASIVRTVQGDAPTAVAPIAGESELVVAIADDTRALFTNPWGFLNTDPTVTTTTAKAVTLLLTFDPPIALDTGVAPFDVFLARSGDYPYQIHQPQYAGTSKMRTSLFDTANDTSTATRHFVNENGIPFALDVPELVVWPQEHAAIDLVFPAITSFGQNAGTTDADWYLHPVATDAFTHGAGGSQPPSPALPSPALQLCSPSH
jgi:LruC domain-containing protein